MAGGDKMSSEDFVRLSKEHAELKPVIDSIVAWQDATRELADLEEIIEDRGNDADMRALAEDEIYEVRKKLHALENQVKIELLPKDAADEKNAILEIRAGTGGDEAALFAGDLFRMYVKYAEARG